MLRKAPRLLFKVQTPTDVRGTVVKGGVPHRRRQFSGAPAAGGTEEASGAARRPTKHAFVPPQRSRSGSQSVGRVLSQREERATPTFSNFPNASSSPSPGAAPASQRQRYRAQQQQQEGQHGAHATTCGSPGAPPASFLSPLPAKYGFYDGIDEHGLEAVPRVSRELQQRMMRQALEAQAASVVELTEGGEADIDLGGMPASEFHGQQGWTTIPRESALYSSVLARDELESRQRTNSWTVARRRQGGGGASSDRTSQSAGLGDGDVAALMGEYAAADRRRAAADPRASTEPPSPENDKEGRVEDEPGNGGGGESLDGLRRRRHSDEGSYSGQLEGELLEPHPESVGQPRSVYGLRKMFVKGLVGYQGIVSRAEEAAIAEELLRLLQDPHAAYVAEETRYCVNLYETELGVPGRDTLAFSIASAPHLQRVLYRFFFLGLIPAVPNVVQVSEMVGNFSGYPVHRKPRAIGSYVGLLNLVSTTVMHMQHRDCPWYPRLHINPRSLFVVTEPCLSEYAMGYKQTHQPFHSFEYATRVSKDYRIEVLFATVETEHMRHLSEAVQLTEYANAKRIAGGGGATPPQGVSSCGGSDEGGAADSTRLATSIDSYLERLRAQTHLASESNSAGIGEGDTRADGAAAAAAIVDGHELRDRLRSAGAVGSKAQGFITIPTTTASATESGSHTPTAASSAARRRLAALKSRHDFAKQLRSEKVTKESQGGSTLIRGHAPGDRRPQ